MSNLKHKPKSLIWKGALFGIANIVPGVSGGTLAVITGVYDDLMNAISHFIKEWKFLLLYLIGAGIGIIGGSFSIEFLFEKWPEPTLFCFIGFILGGIPLLWKKGNFKGSFKPSWIISFFIAFTLILSMKFIFNPTENEAITTLSSQTAILVFLSGALAASAMVIPGISGSFLLLLVGMYTTFVSAITHFNLPIILIAGIGVALGIIVTAKIIGFCLKNFYQITYMAILGLIIGSIIVLFPGFPNGLLLLSSLLFFALGCLGGYLLGDK